MAVVSWANGRTGSAATRTCRLAVIGGDGRIH